MSRLTKKPRHIAVAAAVLLSFSMLASCGQSSTTAAKGTVSADNPFGVADNSTIDAVIFKGGYGTDYAQFVADELQKNHKGVTVKVSGATDLATQLQARFVGGNPPDVLDNSGSNQIPMASIGSQLADLTPVLDANNLDGKKISDTLYNGVLDSGKSDGKQVQIGLTLTVFGLWYSDSLFKAQGWQLPKSWDEMKALGADAKSKGKYLFSFGKEASDYYQEMAITSAAKQGGQKVLTNLGNLEKDSWSDPAIQDSFKEIEEMVKAGYFIPGGAGTQFTAAQAAWSNKQEALFYPSGSWIGNEMKEQTAPDFQMSVAPVPVKDPSSSALPYETLHTSSGEPYSVPAKAKNEAGGKEFLRILLSKDSAANFSKATGAMTVVKDSVPADGFGDSGLKSQVAALSAADSHSIDWSFDNIYGLGADQRTLWNQFLGGTIGVDELTKGRQAISDKVREDPSVKKVTFK